MSAATSDINTNERYGDIVYLPIAASTIIYAGTLVSVNSSGQAISAADTASTVVVGRAELHVDNSADGTGGALSVPVKRGIFAYANAPSTNNLGAADVGQSIAYVYDNQTVGKAAGTTNSIKAGIVVDYDSVNNLVWIDTRRKSL